MTLKVIEVGRVNQQISGTIHTVADAGHLPAPESAQPADDAPGSASASGPSEEDMRDFRTTGLVRIRLKDAAMAVQQASPQVSTLPRLTNICSVHVHTYDVMPLTNDILPSTPQNSIAGNYLSALISGLMSVQCIYSAEVSFSYSIKRPARPWPACQTTCRRLRRSTPPSSAVAVTASCRCRTLRRATEKQVWAWARGEAPKTVSNRVQTRSGCAVTRTGSFACACAQGNELRGVQCSRLELLVLFTGSIPHPSERPGADRRESGYSVAADDNDREDTGQASPASACPVQVPHTTSMAWLTFLAVLVSWLQALVPLKCFLRHAVCFVIPSLWSERCARLLQLMMLRLNHMPTGCVDDGSQLAV